MSRKKKMKMEYRFYEVPEKCPVLALLGEKWVQNYGYQIDYLHFHNMMEISFCAIRELSLYSFVIKPSTSINSHAQEHRLFSFEFVVCGKFFGTTVNAPRRTEFLYLPGQLSPLRNSRRRSPSYYEKEEFYLEEVKGLTRALLMQIARWNEKDETQEKNAILDDASIALILPALNYIGENFHESIRIEELADVCHISETHLRRIFQESMRMPPVEYINWVRIRAACKELRKTNASVSDIALHCGFTTISTFNRNFRKILGVSPQQWRRAPEHYEQNLLKFDIKTQEGW